MTTVRVGLVGYGFSGSTFHAPVLAAAEGLRLTAVVSSKADRVRADWPDVRTYRHLHEILADADVDVVVLTSPNTEHFPQAKAALEAGKHVVVEKPFTVTSREADDLIDQAARRGLVLSVYHNRRWDNDFRTVRRVLDTGLLGRVHSYEAHFDRYRPEVRQRWREQDLPGSGILYDLGPHLIDQALVLFGSPQTVTADLAIQRLDGASLDVFHVVLGYPQLRVSLSAGMLMRSPGPRFALHGDRGSFVKHGLDPQEEALKQGRRPPRCRADGGVDDRNDWGADPPDAYGLLVTEVDGLELASRIPTEQGYYPAYYRELAAAIRNGEPPPVAAAAGRDTIRVIELAHESDRSGRRVPWPRG